MSLNEQHILQKPKGFKDKFGWKGEGQEVCSTHYCPGCGHGIIHKYFAEAISDLNIQDRTILISPIGCSAFAYHYFDIGNVAAAHGRAPATATGVKRQLPHSIVISYQGDGDLAAIGTAEIIHAANRGENITVIFVNNAIYGMTGGQMAPTSLLGQVTSTSPLGRSAKTDGYPLKMSEVISALEAPVYVERVSLCDVPHRTKARQAIRKAIQNQIDGKGFSFVEILSACPSGWKKSAPDANDWVKNVMHNVFPIKVFKDVGDTVEPYFVETPKKTDAEIFNALNFLNMSSSTKYKGSIDLESFKDRNLRIAGFGGQGVISAGHLLSVLGMNEGLNTSWIPSYGPEMRGGTSNCHVRFSSKRIGTPIIEIPNSVIVMNRPSFDLFVPLLEEDGIAIINSSLIDIKTTRTDIKAYYVPATKIAEEVGITAAQTISALTAYVLLSGMCGIEPIEYALKKSLKKKQLLEKNIEVVRKTEAYIKNEIKQNISN